MAEMKERSGIFKFFYIVLSIITFPIFMLLFILRHPFWLLFFLCAAAGGAAYYPMSQGVKPEEILTWYEGRYKAVKFELVTKALESGKTDYVPQVFIDEITAEKKKMEEEKAEDARPKSENYNKKIDRDVKIEQAKEDLKKRKKGFKTKVDAVGKTDDAVVSGQDEPETVAGERLSETKSVMEGNSPEHGDASLQNRTEMLEKSGASGGLASFLGKKKEHDAGNISAGDLSLGDAVAQDNAIMAGSLQDSDVTDSGESAISSSEGDGVENGKEPDNPVAEKEESGVETDGVQQDNNGGKNIKETDESGDDSFDIFTDDDFKTLQLF